MPPTTFKSKFKKHDTFMNRCLIAIGIFLVIFIGIMIVTFWKFMMIPDTLVTCVLSGACGEALFLALIKIFKVKSGTDEQMIQMQQQQMQQQNQQNQPSSQGTRPGGGVG